MKATMAARSPHRVPGVDCLSGGNLSGVQFSADVTCFAKSGYFVNILMEFENHY